MAYDVKVAFNQSNPLTNVSGYKLQWSCNGVPGNLEILGIAGTYQGAFNLGNPGVTLKPGDVVQASVIAFDAAHNAVSAPPLVQSATIPVAPPASPTNLVLTVTGP